MKRSPDWNILADRTQLILVLPFAYPYRFIQSLIGFPVEMSELNRQIADVWNGTAIHKNNSEEDEG